MVVRFMLEMLVFFTISCVFQYYIISFITHFNEAGLLIY